MVTENVLSLTYLGNVQYYTKLCFEPCVIDLYENFQRQSYRNRCDILSANGVTALTVNTVKSDNWSKATVKQTKIDYSKQWQHRHWQSLLSSYRSSPYFEFYEHKFEPFYRRGYKYLVDYNAELTSLVLELLGADVELRFSERYIDMSEQGDKKIIDYRDALSPKPRLAQSDPHFRAEPYWQVFSREMEFVPNLSIIDLLFSEGPAAIVTLRNSTLKK